MKLLSSGGSLQAFRKAGPENYDVGRGQALLNCGRREVMNPWTDVTNRFPEKSALA
jgi:hypothetical protein